MIWTKAQVRRFAALSALVVFGGCGGQKPPAASPTAPGGEVAGGPVPGGGATPDLSPVAAPAELIAYGRLSNPGGVVDTVMDWAKLSQTVNLRRMLEKEEPEVARILVYDAPIEFAVALDPHGRGDPPQPFAVVSIGLASVDGAVDFAKREGQAVRAVGRGVYKLAKSGGPACAVAPAVGKAPARLVCGDRPEDVDALLGYATRGLPNENMGNADLHMELRAEPIRRLYGKQLKQLKTIATPFVLKEFSLDSPRFDRALADAVHGLADELLSVIDDLDKISIDSTIKKDTGSLDTTLALKLRGQKSWIVQAMVDSSKRSKGIPDMYWRLPKDSATATYGIGASPKRYDPIRKSVSELLDGLLEHEKVPKKVRDQLTDIIQDTWTTEATVVYARGDLPPGAAAGAAPVNRSRERVKQEIGWYLVGIDDKPAKYKTYFDKIAKLYNDAQVKQIFDKRLHVKPNEMPRVAARGGRGLPPGSTVYEITVPGALFDKGDPFAGMGGAKKVAAAPLPVLLAVVPDGDRTWLGFSTDEKLLGQKVADTKKPETSLASRDGLAPLKSSGGQSGGFLSLGYFVNSILASLGEMAAPGESAKLFQSMPHKGETPMLLWTTLTNDGPKLSWSLKIPKAVVEDIAAMAPALASGALSAPPPVPPPAPVPPGVRKAPTGGAPPPPPKPAAGGVKPPAATKQPVYKPPQP